MFKSATLHSLGLNSWSVLGSNVSKVLYQQLSLLPYRFVCLGDDDKAGEDFARTFSLGTTSKDLDELDRESLWTLVKQFL